MKTKLLLFLGLAIASVSLAVTFGAAPAYAKGEKYAWTDANTIHASNWNIDTISFKHDFDFKKDGDTNIYKFDAPGSCDIVFTISPSADIKSGTLSFNDSPDDLCRETVKDLDKNITIANPEKGPVPDGAEVNYNTVNCATYYTDANKVPRCQAIKKCFLQGNKPVADCLSAWNTCIANHTNAGGISNDDTQICVDAVGKGDLAAATAPVKTDADKTSCAIVGIGWIVCPVVSFLSLIVDASYGFVSSLLFVQPLLVTEGTSSNSIYVAWSTVRNIANIAFVVAFLVIIFSQLTSIGITNYGIKKMLPRIIVSAILVNLSYFLCAAAIDISNIMGSSVNQVLQNTKDGLTLPNGNAWGETSAQLNGWAGISGGLLAGTVAIGAAFYIGISALLPALIAVFLVIITVFLVLTLRQALIILLVVVAPLAFVARLLPNTEGLFKKWFDLGKILLIMYPTVSLIFGASALASTIIMATATGDYKIAIQIMGAAVSVLPLVVVPTLIKTTSGVLGKIGGIVDNPNRGPISAMKKGATNYRGYRQNVRGANALANNSGFGKGQFKRSYRKELRNQAAEGAAKSGQAQFGTTDQKAAGYVASNTQSQAQISAINAANSSRFVNSVASNPGLVSKGMGGAATDPEVIKALGAQQQKAVADAIRDVELTANLNPGDVNAMGNRLADAIQNGDSITARAMQNMLIKSGTAGTDQYRKTMESVPPGSMGSPVVDDMKRNMLENHSGVKETAADLVKHATSPRGTTMSNVTNAAKTWSMSEQDLVKQKSHSLERARKAKGISVAQANTIKQDDQLYRQLDKEGKQVIEDVINGKP